ncbi:autorepressor SdpR family transcription factor [Thermotalea metallivorans]|uniref:Transcriptional repressor SdpR n=1 Tax=Thermotalea metallivorans TaxID=520762 RepID=A0A140KZZ6_9FIRM|nr:autorepressor SdpR family transcription factor [Thermotalea metallivorans]KXG73871.1 Transcriptional repressor SdpR [Thermotalea metallivorans]
MNDIFKALADPTRRKILKMLREGDLSAGEIADAFYISKPSISHHLNLLKQAGLVLSEKQGQNVYYSLNTTIFQEVMQWFFEFMERGESDENQ